MKFLIIEFFWEFELKKSTSHMIFFVTIGWQNEKTIILETAFDHLSRLYSTVSQLLHMQGVL